MTGKKLNFKSSHTTSKLSVSHTRPCLQTDDWNTCSFNALSQLRPAGAQLPLRGMYL